MADSVTKNKPNIQRFLTKLNWIANTGDLKQMDTFRMDVYQFDFSVPLRGECLTGFTQFIQNLPMNEIRSVLKIWVWLYQHEVKFRLRFSWNMRLSVKHNIKNLRKPGKFQKTMSAFTHEELMACPLEK